MKTAAHIIMLSVDRAVLTPGSSVQKRMEHFGTLANGIDVIVLGAVAGDVLQLQNNVRVHGVTGSFKIGAGIAAIKLAKELAGPQSLFVTQDPFELGVLGVIASWLTRRPLNVQVHIDFFSPYFRQESIRLRFQAIIAPF